MLALRLLALALPLALCRATADLSAGALFFDTFGAGWQSRWIHSTNSKYDGKFEEVTPKEWSEPGLAVGGCVWGGESGTG